MASTTNDYLLQLATALFEGALKTERREETFGNIVELEDSKRIPLNSRDREQRKGPYPYYGATSIMGYVDDYLFDGVRILLGEDGSVITDDGRPVLQYVWGKYWVNNHAHILKPCSDYSLEMLYIALNRTSIPHIVTGAVQKKISQKNLNTLVLEMPNPLHMKGLDEIFGLYRANVDENKQLEQLRDTLLPRLMSGEIDVSEVELLMPPNNHLYSLINTIGCFQRRGGVEIETTNSSFLRQHPLQHPHGQRSHRLYVLPQPYNHIGKAISHKEHQCLSPRRPI